ncbi:YdgA family protein [Pasteurella bettyae]|uniref:YdgA family protein n=1 Tax=Pasteurella bettyae TaxID=752 RepID=UPI003D2A2CF9
MNKSKLAAAVIIALGAVWTGGAWFTGKTAETEYQYQLDRVNQQLSQLDIVKELNYELKITDVSFERGLFSSDIHYAIEYTSLKDQNKKGKLPFESKLYHGPLPLNLVRQLNFTPAIFSETSQLVKNEQTQILFDTVKDKIPLNTELTLTYAQQLKGALFIAAGEFESSDDIKASWSDASIKFDVNKEGEGKYDYSLQDAKITLSGEQLKSFEYGDETKNKLQSLDIAMQDLKGQAEITDSQKLYLGNYDGILGNLKYSYHYEKPEVNGLSMMQFDQWNFSYQATENDGFLNYDSKNKLSAVTFNQKNLGEVVINVKAEHLLASALNKLSDAALLEDNKAVDSLLMEILKNQPHLQILPFSIKNDKGLMSHNINIELANVDLNRTLKLGKFLSLFKQLSWSTYVDKSALANLYHYIDSLSEKTNEKSDKQVQQEIDQLIKDLHQQNVIVEDEKFVKLDLRLENGKLKLNDHEIPEEYISMMIFALMLQHH